SLGQASLAEPPDARHGHSGDGPPHGPGGARLSHQGAEPPSAAGAGVEESRPGLPLDLRPLGRTRTGLERGPERAWASPSALEPPRARLPAGGRRRPMMFFFPDSQDLVDPSFDFRTEQRSETRVRQRDDLYPHEVFASPPYDGILVSKGIVDG